MAGNPSAMKRQRQNAAQREQNRKAKSTVRTAVKKFKESVEAEDTTAAAERLKLAVSLIDTNTRKGLYHKNTAARKKSRLTAMYNKLA